MKSEKWSERSDWNIGEHDNQKEQELYEMSDEDKKCQNGRQKNGPT